MPAKDPLSLLLRRAPLALLLQVLLAVLGCSAAPQPPPDVPCACTPGSKRCQGDQIQVCESGAAGCPAWGPASACPNGSCTSDACPGLTCTDTCPGGSKRCSGEADQEVCRVGPSGCLEWVRQGCPANQYCGAADGQCAPVIPCDLGCPTGYTCSRAGVCVGGDPTRLTLNVKTAQVSGTITLNGAAPVRVSCPVNSASYAKASVVLKEKTRGVTFYLRSTCANTDFAFSGPVHPGTYEVSVVGDYSNIPGPAYLINPALTIGADLANLALDVKTAQVSGTVTLNGAAPVRVNCPVNSASYAKASVVLKEKTRGVTFYLRSTCANTDFAFSGPVYPGTYELSVLGDYSNVPGQEYLINPALIVSADTANLALNVKTAQVSGVITLNGAAPVRLNCPVNSASYAKASAVLRDKARGVTFYLRSTCANTDFAFSGPVYPGTYELSVLGESSDIPNAAYLINPALTIGADTANLALDVKTAQVSGAITLNGAAPARLGCPVNSSSYAKASVVLRDKARGVTFYLRSTCANTDFAFSGPVYPGTYELSVLGEYSSVPNAAYLINPALTIGADTANLALDVKTAQVSGAITLNGAAPARLGCPVNSSSYAKASAVLRDKARGVTFYLRSTCANTDFAFSGLVYPGTYELSVLGEYSNVPGPAYLINPALTIGADLANLALDVKTVPVAGVITLNGAAPVRLGCPVNSSSYAKASALLRDKARGVTFYLNTTCANTDFAFSGLVYPGTYEVSASGGYSDIPEQDYLVFRQLQLP